MEGFIVPLFALSRRSLFFLFFLALISLAGVFAATHFTSARQSDGPQAKPDSYCASPGNELKAPAARGVLVNDTGSLLEDPITTGSLVSEITATSNTEFLVDERDGKFPLDPATAPQIKKIWQISLTGATDISDPADSDKGLLAGGKTLEALVNRLTTSQALSTLAANNIKPVTKTLKVDLVALLASLNPAGKFFPHDKIEGIALIDGGKKLVVSDDSDFGVGSTNPVSFGLAAKTLPTTGEVDYGEILIVDLGKLPARTATATVTITVGDNQPPVITTPANLTAVTSSPTAGCAVVNFSVKASDNCGAVDVTTNPPSGSCFPLGVTTVTSAATDTAGNKATASFKVTVWDVSLQDDSSGDLLLFNSRTGDYNFNDSNTADNTDTCR